ncbi:hypothetical protein ACRAQ7_02955 [Erythrobacter sp. W53]|uniref:hypothetical protein n=1 Tax=Erythrobacter sp. W53 TaxID=3425947 RepID=UPI003D769A55
MKIAKAAGVLLLKVGFVIAVTALAWFHLAASIMFVCAIVLLAVAGRLESLVEFSFGPLRAKIEKNLSASEELLENLKNFAVVQARAANAASVHTGRFATNDDWIFRSMKRLETSLVEIGVEAPELREARSDFVRLTIRDAGGSALGGGRIPTVLGEGAVSEWRQVDRGNPDEVESFLIKWDVMNDEREDRISDMRWMIENEDVRDSEQYVRAHTDVEWGDMSK